MTEAETWSTDRLHRTLKLANTPVVELPSGAALVHTDEGWEHVGDVTVHGDLPDPDAVTGIGARIGSRGYVSVMVTDSMMICSSGGTPLAA